MTHTFNLDQIKKVLENIDVSQAVEQGLIAYSEGKAVVLPVGEMIFEDPPGN
jgi:ornithine cyclodeaminase